MENEEEGEIEVVRGVGEYNHYSRHNTSKAKE